MFEVKIIEDSINNHKDRLTTFQLRYWRPIHSEVMTHRKFSRNGRSSRAVPVKTLLKEPIFLPKFQKNMPGMQAKEPLTGLKLFLANFVWMTAARINKLAVYFLHKLDVHKQWANRPLEWFGYIDVVVSSTDWENFFILRYHPDAQPEFYELARLIKEELNSSKPKLLGDGEWHLPYVSPEERNELSNQQCIKLSVARCARVSYKPFDGNASLEREIKRFEKLVGSIPIHASPAEHQATPYHPMHGNYGLVCKNYEGWVQERSFLEGLVK